MKKCVSAMKKVFLGEEVSMEDVIKPDITLVISENRKERKTILTWNE